LLNVLPLFLTFYKQLSEFVLRQTLSFFVVRLDWLNILSARFDYVVVCLSDSRLYLNGLLLGFYLYLSGHFLNESSISWISMMTTLSWSSVICKKRVLLIGGGRSRFCFLVPREP
jgi:hypothetical protein